jgi:hypothetical protein
MPPAPAQQSSNWQKNTLGQLDAVGAGGAARWLIQKYNENVPTVWQEERYSPNELRQWQYEKSFDEATKTLYLDWKNRAKEVLLRRVPEYEQWHIQSQGAKPVGRNQTALKMLYGDWVDPQDPSLPISQNFVTGFLNWLEDRGMAQPLAEDGSVTPEQKAQWDNDLDIVRGLNSNYRLNPSGQQNMQATRDYMLLRTFQTDARHRPAHLSAGAYTTAVGLPSAFLDPTDMTGKQAMQAFTGTPKAAMENALMWDDHYQDRIQESPEYWNDVVQGATLPSFSATTLSGLQAKTTQGDSWIGRNSRYFTNPMLMPNFMERERDDFNRFMDANDRVTPIRNNRNKYVNDLANSLTQDARNLETDNWRQVSTYFPNAINAVNDRFGTNIEPFYPPAIVNDAAMIAPGILGDPLNLAMTAGSAGLGLLGKSAVGAVGQALMQNISDFPAEMGASTAISMTQQPKESGLFDYLTKPDPGVPLRDESGNIPDPSNRKAYEDALARHESGRKNVVERTQMFKEVDKPRDGLFLGPLSRGKRSVDPQTPLLSVPNPTLR